MMNGWDGNILQYRMHRGQRTKTIISTRDTMQTKRGYQPSGALSSMR